MQHAAKVVAFAFALCISTVGIVGLVVPAALVWVAQQFVASGALAFYVLATVRIAFGLILISAASVSRVPTGLRMLGGAVVILGIVTALAGSVAIEESHAAIAWWEHQSRAKLRVTSGAVLAVGSFVGYACAPRS